MVYDILKKVRAVLLADTAITNVVGQNIKVGDQPVARATKQITLRKSYGTSNSIIQAGNPTVFITVWIKQKDSEEPYKDCATVVDRIITLFNRKGSSLNTSDLEVNQMVKVDASITYNDEQEMFVGVIIFDTVHNE